MPPISPEQNPRRLERMAREQDNVVSLKQLHAAGYRKDAIRRRVQAGRWQRLGHAVVLHGGPLRRAQREWAALLTAGQPSALAGPTAAADYGLRGFETTSIHVLVPHRRHLPSIPGVVWHVSKRFDEFDICVRDGMPIVSRGRAIADAAAWTRQPRVACGLAIAAVQQRVATVRQIRSQLSPYVNGRHGRLILAILADVEGGADSLNEIDFTALARKAGLPPPIRQSVRRDSSGRRRYIDVDFGCFVVEVDGAIHLRAMTYWDDARRQNDLVIGGDRVLRFPSIAIRLEPEVVIAQLRAAWERFSGQPLGDAPKRAEDGAHR